MINLNESILAEGLPYNIELNTGTSFENVVYLGMKHLNGKQLLIFCTKDNCQLSINPSFHTYTLEQVVEDFEETNKKETENE